MIERREHRRAHASALAAGLLVAIAGCNSVGVGTIDGVGPPFRQEWELKARMLEAGSVYDDGSLEELAETHVPELRLSDSQTRLFVTVPQSMTSDHWVSAIYLRDSRDVIVSFIELTQPFPSENFADVTLSFDVPTGVSSVSAYAHCTEHGVWKSAPLAVPLR